MVIKSIILFSLLALAACLPPARTCNKKFNDGDLVHHKIFQDEQFVVLRSADRTNWEGYCLVSLRTFKDGKIVKLVDAELTY